VGYIDQNDSIHYITVADGLVNDYIWDLTVDSKGRLWVATGDGLCAMRTAGGRHSTGNRTGSFRTLASHADRSGGIRWHAGRGVAILDIDASNTPEPRIELDVPTTEGRIS